MTGGKVAIAIFGFVVLLSQLFPIDARAQSWPPPIAHVLCHSEKNEAIVYFATEDSPDAWIRRRDQAYRQATGHDLDLAEFQSDADTCSLANGWEIKATFDYEWGSHVSCSPNTPYAIWINKRRINGGVTACHFTDGQKQSEVAVVLIDEMAVQECRVAWADDGSTFNFESVEVGYRCASLGTPSTLGERDYRSYPENNQPAYPPGLIATFRKDESLCRPAVPIDEGGEDTLPDDIARILMIFPDNIRRTLAPSITKTGWRRLEWGRAHLASENSDLIISRAIFDPDNSGRKFVVYEIYIQPVFEIDPRYEVAQNFWLIFDQSVVTLAQEKVVKDLRISYLSGRSSYDWITALYRNTSFRTVGTRQFSDRGSFSVFSAVRIGATLYLVAATTTPDVFYPDIYYGHYHRNDVLFHRENFTVLYKPLPGGRFETICTYDQFGRPFSPYP